MDYSFQDKGERQALKLTSGRIVVKIGTQLLTDVKGQTPQQQIVALLDVVAQLRERGLEIVIVSSGAVGMGMRAMQVSRRPKSLDKLQAYAAIGQNHLMRCYVEAAEKHGFTCGQLLLTAADLHDLDRNRHVSQCLDALLAAGVLPVINENDSVCTDEIKVGDNDTLAAYVATMCRASLTILLTTVDAMHELQDDSTLGERVSVVRELSAKVKAQAKGTDGNEFSTGGMQTKLRAAEIVNRTGDYLVVAGGKEGFSVLLDILDGKDVGTVFVPRRQGHMHSRQRFLAFFAEPAGTLIIDSGAEKALCQQNRSLLPGGVLGTRGVFHRGDTVRIVNAENKEIGRGIINFAHDEMARICGVQSGKLAACLQREVHIPEVIHRDYMVLEEA